MDCEFLFMFWFLISTFEKAFAQIDLAMYKTWLKDVFLVTLNKYFKDWIWKIDLRYNQIQQGRCKMCP